MKTTSNMKASVMKSIFLALALIATIGTTVHAQTYRPATNTKLILNSTYPSGNALTLQTGAGQVAYTLTLPASAPTAGYLLQSDPANANTLIWSSPLGLYDFQNGLTESGTNTVKWGGDLTGATTINTADYALTFANNGSGSSALTIGGGSATLTLDVRGATTINTNGSAATSIGNSNATFTLVSSTGLNVTATGEISDGNGNVLVADNIEPTVNDNFSLGTNTARWSDVFVGPSTVHIGSTTASGDELALSYNTTSNTANINVGSVDVLQITSALTTATKPVSITDATTSTSSTTGALKVAGGVGIGENINVAGTGAIAGDFAVNTNKFAVAATSGNTTIAGTLDVTGAAALNSTLSVTGATTLAGTLGVTGATTLSSTLDVTGATTVTGATALNGGLTMDTDKFTVADGSGNTSIGGTLAVAGATTLGAATIDALTSGAGSYLSVGGSVFEMYRQSAANTNKSSLVFGSGGTADGKVLLSSRINSDATTISLELNNSTAKLGNTVFNTYVDQDPVNGYVQIIADNTSVKVDQTSITIDGPTSVTNTLDVTGTTTIDALSNDEGAKAVIGTNSFEMYYQAGAGANDNKSSLTFGDGATKNGRVQLFSRKTDASTEISLDLDNGTAKLGNNTFNAYVDRDPATGYVELLADNTSVRVDQNAIRMTGGHVVSITVQNGAYTATGTDYIIVQSGNGDITLPLGEDGRMYIVKNTYTAGINVLCQAADDFEDGTNTLALGIGATAKLVWSGGVWYQVGN